MGKSHHFESLAHGTIQSMCHLEFIGLAPLWFLGYIIVPLLLRCISCGHHVRESVYLSLCYIITRRNYLIYPLLASCILLTCSVHCAFWELVVK